MAWVVALYNYHGSSELKSAIFQAIHSFALHLYDLISGSISVKGEGGMFFLSRAQYEVECHVYRAQPILLFIERGNFFLNRCPSINSMLFSKQFDKKYGFQLVFYPFRKKI